MLTMTVCKHCFVDSATVATQAQMIHDLEVRIHDLKIEVQAHQPGIKYVRGLTNTEHRMLALLLLRDIVPHDALFAQVKHFAEEPEPKGLHVAVCRLRKKIEPLGLTIINVFAKGYYIPREQREPALQELAA